MKTRSIRRWLCVVALTACFLTASAMAAHYPNKPIQIIIPTGVGGDTDLNARIFSKYLEKELGTSLVCTNIVGAGGAVGARQVKDSPPDGYTLLFFQYAGIIQQMTGVVDFSYVDDFEMAGIAMFDRCNVWLGQANSPYKTLADVIDDAKKRPGQVNIGLSGTGNMAHYLAKLLEVQSGARFNLVDLGGQSQLQAALLSGQIAGYTAYYSNSRAFIDSGDFTVLATYSDGRHPLLPDAPTMGEQGMDTNFLNDKYYYYAFPKGTPKDIVDTFSAAMKTVCANPDAQKDFAKYYITLDFHTPEQSIDYIKDLERQYGEHADIFQK